MKDLNSDKANFKALFKKFKPLVESSNTPPLGVGIFLQQPLNGLFLPFQRTSGPEILRKVEILVKTSS